MPDSGARPFGRVFMPGPTDVRPEVLAAMNRPMIGHRVREMEELIAHVQPRLRAVFRTERPVYISASSATGLMEGAVRNGARKRVLSLVNGAFSGRFFQIAKATGLAADAVEVAWGEPHTPDMLAEALRKGPYDAVTVVHSETSTGVLNPVRELTEAAHAAGDVVVLVDTVSSMAGAEFRTDEWGVDFVLTGSQKSLALPPGLAFGVAQQQILERARAKTDRGVYFDFLEFEKNIAGNQTPNTPAVSLLYALRAQLDLIEQEGMEARLARHRAMAERVWSWVDHMREERGVAMRVLAPAGYRSPTVSCITVPAGWSGPKLYAAVRERGFEIATGYGQLREQTFRIGHMGDHTVATVEELLDVLEVVLENG
ncbi:MAG: alanine--glyoxylate aminotransferase family protein [Gemmatimonadetes bacterium]|nr:alanine--glyoxylate aminotransferase family protein [Gemmatimonadota bacterium]